MKRILLTTLTIATFGVANAQLTNLGLNTWAGGEPTGWGLTSEGLGITGSVTQITSGAPEGTSAAAVNVVACPACVLASLPDPMTGFMVQNDDYTAKPTTFSFKWKGMVATGDTGLVALQLTNMGTVIGEARFNANPGTNQATWTTQNVTVTYSGSMTPDTAIIGVAADQWPLTVGLSGGGSSNASTHMDVDDFKMTGGSVGYEMIEANNALIFAYPNPASNMVYFNLLGTDASIMEMVDITGKVVYTETNMAIKTSVDVSGFNNGAYFVRFLNEKKEYIGTARFNVAR